MPAQPTPSLIIQFPQHRLNDMAGDPYWIDVTRDEARQWVERLEMRLAAMPDFTDTAPIEVTLR
ncbi:hypothetical protein [Robbsia andropogonis]|uniref:hypothetical protein n=1 Tax=Robbsia andropogonis TaxID=28092 RepID=UPI0009DCFCC8|nr:hypothetical protein [Robbsia andropogonis]